MGHLFVNFKGFFGVLTHSMKTEPTTVFYVPLYYVEEEWRLGKFTTTQGSLVPRLPKEEGI